MKKNNEKEDMPVLKDGMNSDEILDTLGIDKKTFEEIMFKTAIGKRIKELEEKEDTNSK